MKTDFALLHKAVKREPSQLGGGHTVAVMSQCSRELAGQSCNPGVRLSYGVIAVQCIVYTGHI